jgi:PAS domain S-box-containing protein
MKKTSLSEISVLYVEDEKMIRDEIIDILEGETASFYVAKNGKEGLELFKEYKPDLVLTDIRMPEMDGIEMSKAILQLEPGVPIIISSAFNDSEYFLESIRLGIHYYLIKPINIKELFCTLEKASAGIINARRLKQSENLLTQYKDAVDKSEIVSKTDKRGIITYVNEGFCTISGYGEAELLGKSHNIVRHPDNSEQFYKEIWETILAKEAWHGTIKNRAKDGSFYIVESTIIPILNAHNEIEEFISIRKDITQKELHKQRLEEDLHINAKTLDEKIQFIYEYEKALKQSTLFCRTTTYGNITMASDAFINLMGLDESTVLDSSYLKLVDKGYLKKLDAEVRKAVSSAQSWQGIVKHKNALKQELYLNTSFIPVLNIEGEVHEVLCFHTDMTEQIHLNREIIATQREVISTMGAIGETRSKETGDHVKRVAEYSKLLALKCGLSLKEAEEIKMASPMHDIGKVGIPDNILNKPGKLTYEEFEVMKTHAVLGYDMLKASQQPLLKTAATISHEHHEKWDGSGYPRGLKAEEIHLYGRITAIADVFDALGHDRVYKEAWPLDKILELFEEGKGKHFDPTLIDLFFTHLDEFLAIKEAFDSRSGELFETL